MRVDGPRIQDEHEKVQVSKQVHRTSVPAGNLLEYGSEG